MSQGFVHSRRGAVADALTSVAARRVFAVVTFALLTALSARFALPLPGTAVPITLQTLVVMLAGLLLGPVLGAGAMGLYLLMGLTGVPAFAAGMGPAYLLGPTGGYLLAFPAAAALCGAVAGLVKAERGWTRAAGFAAAAALCAATVFAGGWAQLALLTGDGATALRLGVLPFLPGDALKVLVAVLIATRLRRRTLSLL